jgi:hypothetical protein
MFNMVTSTHVYLQQAVILALMALAPSYALRMMDGHHRVGSMTQGLQVVREVSELSDQFDAIEGPWSPETQQALEDIGYRWSSVELLLRTAQSEVAPSDHVNTRTLLQLYRDATRVVAKSRVALGG